MDSFLITLRETIEYSFILLLLSGIYRESTKSLIITAALVVLAGVFVTWFNYPLSGLSEKVYTGFKYYSFMMILFLSLIAGKAAIYPIICIVLALFIPSAQLTSVIMSNASLGGGHTLIHSLAGALTGALICTSAFRLLWKLDVRRFFGPDGIMVFISAFCFLFGGLNEFDDSSVVTTLHKGVHTFISSVIIFMKGRILVPHGGMITTPVDDTLSYLASERVSMAVTALVLSIPPLYVFIRLLLTPEPATDITEIKAERRKIIAVYADELLRKGTPLLVSLLISIVLIHSANLAMNPKYDPEPVPVVAEGDGIFIPLKDKFGDISDGRMRKYSLRQKGEVYRLIVMMRPDGEVIAALDACEICPPAGYVQRGEHVICKYCGTPVPLHALGQPGGCNPIPLKFNIEGNTLALKRDDVVYTYNKWVGRDEGGHENHSR